MRMSVRVGRKNDSLDRSFGGYPMEYYNVRVGRMDAESVFIRIDDLKYGSQPSGELVLPVEAAKKLALRLLNVCSNNRKRAREFTFREG